MARNVQLTQLRDFTGGLNLRADPFQLHPNESPSLMDVDVDPRGGVRLRNGTSFIAGPYDEGAANVSPRFDRMFAHYTTSTYNVLACSIQDANGMQIFALDTSGAMVAVTTTPVNTILDAAQFGSYTYLHSGVEQPWRWTPSVFNQVTAPGFSEFDAPTDNRMPVGQVAAAFQNHYFIANLYESATNYRSRVRFSHPGYAERWRSSDWFDVDPRDGDAITALRAFSDHLVIFKQRSMHMLVGYGWDSWSRQPISMDVGAVHQQAVTSTPNGLFFWNNVHGLMRWDGRSVESVFDPLKPLIDEGTFNVSRSDEVHVSAMEGGRVWVVLPVGSGTEMNTYVYDPSLGRNGAWTRYSFGPTAILHATPVSGDHRCWGAFTDSTNQLSWTVDLSDPTVSTDELTIVSDGLGWWTAGPTTVIPAHYQTSWVDAGNAAVKKRWRRVRHALYAEGQVNLTVQVYRDYNQTSSTSSWGEVIGTTASESVYGTATYGTSTYGSDDSPIDLEVAAPLGLCNAVSLRYTALTATSRWGVDAIVFPFTPKKIR